MKWLEFISNIIQAILRLFGAGKVSDEDAKKKQEEIDAQVQNADNGGLVDIAVDGGLVQRSVHSGGVSNGGDGKRGVTKSTGGVTKPRADSKRRSTASSSGSASGADDSSRVAKSPGRPRKRRPEGKSDII